MVGHLALPAGSDRRPAVLLGPEGMGLSDVERRRADALAELGYVALAFDLHGGRYLGAPEEMLGRCMPLLADPDRMRGIGHAALDVLRTESRTDPDRVAAVGYGTGGAIALELGRDGVNLRAIGTVNATTTGRPGEAAHIRCPVWAGVGSEDPIMPPAQRNAFTAEMQAAGVDWRLAVYGGALHAFHHPPVDHPTVPGVGYHPQHAQRAWRDVVDLLAECLPLTDNPEACPRQISWHQAWSASCTDSPPPRARGSARTTTRDAAAQRLTPGTTPDTRRHATARTRSPDAGHHRFGHRRNRR
ncbi:hypothetical protein SUDANB13_06513 [Streptomyces sp. enrichment culture]